MQRDFKLILNKKQSFKFFPF